MRKKFVYFVLVPVLVVAALLYLFLDSWIEAGLESAGESLVGARVEIDRLRLSLAPLGIAFDRLQVANPRDPWKNLFETGRVNFEVNTNQLLRGKVIVDSVEVRGLLLGTARTTDGSLPTSPAAEAPSPGLSDQMADYAAEQAKETPVFDLENLRRQLNLDSLLSLQTLRSTRHLDSLKQLTQSLSGNWNTALAGLDEGKEKLRGVESTIRSININELKSVEALTAAVAKVNDAYRTVDDLSRSFQSTKGSVTADLQRLTAGLGAVDDVVRDDIRSVQALARLPDLSLGGISGLLLGESLLAEARQYLSYVELAGSTVRRYRPKPSMETPPRFTGQNIEFPVEQSYPKFWIRHVHISAATRDTAATDIFSASGDAHDITNNQDLTGQPTLVLLAGSQAARAAFTFRGSLDRRGDRSLDRYEIAFTSVPLGQLSLGQSSFLPSRITESVADISTDIVVPSGRFDAHTTVLLRNLTLVFSGDPRNTVERLTRDVLNQITSLRFSLRLWNTDGPVNVAFASDLDDQLRSRIQRVLGDELARIQNDIRARVQREIDANRKEVERLISEKKGLAQAKIQEYERILKERIAQAEAKKKELEQRIEQEKQKQTDAAKKKLEDAVKGVFKKKD